MIGEDRPAAQVRGEQDIWLCGGGNLAGQLADEIDELHLKLNPVLLGDGAPLFTGGTPRPLTLLETTPLGAGVVLHRYATGRR